MANYPNTDDSNITAITFHGGAAFTLAPKNTMRSGGTIMNNGAGILYVLLSSSFAAAEVSSTNNTVALASGAYYELPFNYKGVVRCIYSATGTGTFSEFILA